MVPPISILWNYWDWPLRGTLLPWVSLERSTAAIWAAPRTAGASARGSRARSMLPISSKTPSWRPTATLASFEGPWRPAGVLAPADPGRSSWQPGTALLGTQRRNVRLERELADALDKSSRALDQNLVARQSTPSQRVARREQAVLLANALGQLPDDYREVLILHHLEELTFRKWPAAWAGPWIALKTCGPRP